MEAIHSLERRPAIEYVREAHAANVKKLLQLGVGLLTLMAVVMFDFKSWCDKIEAPRKKEPKLSELEAY